MSKEGEVGVAGQRRKSARILALEEKKKQKRNNNNTICKASLSENGFEGQQQLHHGLALSSTTMLPPPLRRGRKQKRLEDLVLSSLAQNPFQQGGENTKDGNTSTKHDQQANGLPSIQWLPEKRILELVLDMLQRRDTQKIFAQPVNPKEVETYYTIIKEPMDFGTMRTKLQEGKYTSLEQFERDVFLISSNAMHFNSSATIYYKEARGMQEVAQMVFRALRTDPYKLESQLIALTRAGRPGRRPRISEIRGPCTRLPRLGGFKFDASPLGTRYGGNSSTLFNRGRSPINRPRIPFCSEYESLILSVYDAHKTLVQNDNNEGFGYKESLLRFVKNLGPTAQKVAARKLIHCLPNYYQVPSSYWQTPIFNPQKTAQRFLLPSPISSFPPRPPYNLQAPKIASIVPNFPSNSNNGPSYGRKNTFNLNLQASPIDQGNSGSSYGGIKMRELADDGGLNMDNLLKPPPKEKNLIDRDMPRKFFLDNKIAEHGGRDNKYPLKGKMVAKTIDFSEKMVNFPGTFLRGNAAGQRENTSQTPFILDNNIAANKGRDTQYPLKGKMVAETNDFNERMENFPQENVAGRENNSQISFVFNNNIATKGEKAFSGIVGNFPGNFFQEYVAGQEENNRHLPFILENNILANRGRDTRYLFKDKMVAQTSDLNEKMVNFPGSFLQENLAVQRGNTSHMPFMLDNNIAANRGRDAQYPLKGKMVAETSDFYEKMRSLPGNFLQETVAGQRENASQIPFMLVNNNAANRVRDTNYPLKDKMVAETNDFNNKMGNLPRNFLKENAAGQKENNSQNKFWLASHFRVIAVLDDDPNTPPGSRSSKTRFRTVDMLAEGNSYNNNHNNSKLQKGKQVEVVHQPSLDRVDQLSTNWKSRLQDFVHRSNDYLFLETSFVSSSPEETRSPSSTDSTMTTISTLLDLLGRSEGPVGPQRPVMGPNYAGNYTQLVDGRGDFPGSQMLLNNEANSLNQLSYAPLRQDLQPASSSGQFGVLMPLYNEATDILQERVADLNQEDMSFQDTQLPDLALQL